MSCFFHVAGINWALSNPGLKVMKSKNGPIILSRPDITSFYEGNKEEQLSSRNEKSILPHFRFCRSFVKFSVTNYFTFCRHFATVGESEQLCKKPDLVFILCSLVPALIF